MSPRSMAATYRAARSRDAERPFEPASEVAQVGRALPCRGEVAEARGEHPARPFLEAPRERIAERRPARARRVEVELLVGDPQQHARVGAEITELVHLVVPRPCIAEVCTRG